MVELRRVSEDSDMTSCTTDSSGEWESLGTSHWEWLTKSQPDFGGLGETTRLSIYIDLKKAKERLPALGQALQDQEKTYKLKNSDTRGNRRCGTYS